MKAKSLPAKWEYKQEQRRCNLKLRMKDLAHNLRFHKPFNGKTVKQNNLSKIQPNVGGDYCFMRPRVRPRTPGCVPNGLRHDTRPNGPNRWCSTLGQLCPPIVTQIPIDPKVQLSWNQFHRESYLISFPGICGLFKSKSICVLGDDFNEPAPGGWGSRIWVELGLHLDLGALLAFLLVLAGSQGLHDHLQSS
jgi:hypothetical protein